MCDISDIDCETKVNYVDVYSNDLVTLPGISLQNNGVEFGINNTNSSSMTTYQRVLNHVNVVLYIVICVLGLIGNGLVIYVILMYAKMKTVTNMYILNLAISDVLFLTMLPITATTVVLHHWVFGLIMCKIYFVLCTLNVFSATCNLCVMSVDRYLAVCQPVPSLKYRTARIALCLCLCVWLLSFIVMLPIFLYAKTTPNLRQEGKYSCKVELPEGQNIFSPEAVVWYMFILGFACPVSFISIFYALVIFRLRRIRAGKKFKDNRRSHSRVTRLIFSVITVYVVCWAPYWCFQVYRTFSEQMISDWAVLLLNGFTILSYANSMLNPLLYAFLSDNFRQSFAAAFKCMSSKNKTISALNDKGVNAGSSNIYIRPTESVVAEKIELSVMEQSLELTPIMNQIYSKIHEDECGFLMPPI